MKIGINQIVGEGRGGVVERVIVRDRGLLYRAHRGARLIDSFGSVEVVTATEVADDPAPGFERQVYSAKALKRAGRMQ